MTVQVYVAPEIAEVEALYPYLRDPAFESLSIREQITRQAETLHEAQTARDSRTRFQILCWWPNARGQSPEAAMTAPFTAADARETIAREYGFAKWKAVDALGDQTVDLDFGAALTTMLAGDIDELTALIQSSPALIEARSRYGHAATLLHYIGANGVETHRQHIPLNAAEIAARLIELGADPEAEANMYGGGQTPLALASTSAHPRNAGIADRLNAVFGDPKETT